MSTAIIPGCVGNLRIGSFCLCRIKQKLSRELAGCTKCAPHSHGARLLAPQMLYLDESLACRLLVGEQCPLFSSVPRYFKSLRELRVSRKRILRLSSRAVNQCRILSAFEDDRWLPRIADPLDDEDEIDPTKRLHDTIYSLNHRQRPHLIRFFCEGAERTVGWDFYRPRTSFRALQDQFWDGDFPN